MKIEDDQKEVIISPKYKPLWQSDKRYFICTGGRGSGKSFSVTLFLLTLTFEEGHRILFTRYTLTSAKTSIIPQFIEVMEALGYDDSIFDKFAELGASVNAFTNHFATCYTFSTVDHVDECISELLRFVQTLDLSEESVEKEKDIVVQEIKMYDDQPQWRAFMNMLQGLYHNQIE